MNIVMVTNTYLPHMGGVARSVDRFAREIRKRRHNVLIIAPEYGETPENETNVLRIPAIRNFHDSGFSLSLPAPLHVGHAVTRFQPDVIHSHHPFLAGNFALRLSASHDLPVVFTHHTMYEQYTHYVGSSAPAVQEFAIQLSKRYAELCDHVVAPSGSVAEILRRRGIATPITVIPTGVDVSEFDHGDGLTFRARHGIPKDAFVLGYTGRLSLEKNLDYLCRAVGAFLQRDPKAWFVAVGAGPGREEMEARLGEAGVGARCVFTGGLDGQALVDAYHGMNVFVFASRSETQGMVLVEAMASGVPVVALAAPGAQDVVEDRVNGRLVTGDDPSRFAEAVSWVRSQGTEDRRALAQAARGTSLHYATGECTGRLLDLYGELLAGRTPSRPSDRPSILLAFEEEWKIWVNRLAAAADAVLSWQQSL